MQKRQAIYDLYWQTSAERQRIFFNKLRGDNPLTADPIFKQYKFCNVYRACDRVSQYLIKHVIYGSRLEGEELLFNIFLFRLLNKNETWEILEQELGINLLKNFDFEHYSHVLENIHTQQPIYGNAFILCANKSFGFDKKHQNHLALLKNVSFDTKISQELLASKSLKQLFERLRQLPLIGDFMAYQLAIDLNYSPLFNFDENDFTIAGPGARRGIEKCFWDSDGKSSEYIIKYMVENQDREFQRLGLNFQNLFGRPMKAIDCQGWFCETDKYTRVSNPDLKSNRVRIKTTYKPGSPPIDYFFPPKWRLKHTLI
ncbi:MAG TPA: nucleotide kinase domain-containing protein [Candidatus Saccharimonadales bacterium]|nr:nucleotide kinase domain-containing protein [Candidatus Saccharimonadales bacterium]